MTNVLVAGQTNSSDVVASQGSGILLSDTLAQDVSINVSPEGIASTKRTGNDLTVVLRNGEVIVLEGYYTDLPGDAQHRLFASDSGEIAQLLADGNALGASVSSELVFGGTGGFPGVEGLSVGVLASGFAGIGTAIALAGSDDDTVDTVANTISASNAREMSGTVEPGATVTVFDLTGAVVGSARADATTGEFSIVPNPLGDGQAGRITVTDAQGNESSSTLIPAVDGVAPLAPPCPLRGPESALGP